MKKVSWITLIAIVLLALPALASHPENDDMYRIERLSRDLKKATRHVHKSARYYVDTHDYGEKYALRALYKLREAADEYECSVDESYGDLYRTEKYFKKLHYAFADAREAFYDLHRHRHLTYEFRRVESLVYELESYYGYHGKASDRPYTKHRRPKIRLHIDWPW